MRERLALLFNCPSFCWLLLWCASGLLGAAFSHIFTSKVVSKGNRSGRGRAITTAGECAQVNVTSSLSWVTECWWLLCFFSYNLLKEAMTSSFSSFSLLGQALWNAKHKCVKVIAISPSFKWGCEMNVACSVWFVIWSVATWQYRKILTWL